MAAEAREAVREAVAEWEVEAECREWESQVAASRRSSTRAGKS